MRRNRLRLSSDRGFRKEGIVNKSLRRSVACGVALTVSMCGIAQASEPVDQLNEVLADTTSIQMELAMAQKRLSIMSGALPDPERCVARELLDTSIGFSEIATEPFLVRRLVNAMKSVETPCVAVWVVSLIA